MLKFFYQYRIAAKGKGGEFSALLTQHEDADQDLQQILNQIREQIKIKLDADGYRDMAVTFLADDIDDIKKVMDYHLDVSAGDTSVENTIKLRYKSIYFKTEGFVTVSVSKTLQHKVDTHHQAVWHIR